MNEILLIIYAIILVHIDDLLIKLVEMVLCYPAGPHDLTPAGSHDLTPAGSHDLTPAGLHDLTPAGSHDMTPAERELDPSHMAIHLIKEVAQGNEMCQEILCKVNPCRKL